MGIQVPANMEHLSQTKHEQNKINKLPHITHDILVQYAMMSQVVS